MNLYFKTSTYFLFAFVFLNLGSCKKLIAIGQPVDQLTTTTVFSTDETATAAIRGIYSDIMRRNNYIGNGGTSLYCALSADELKTTSFQSLYDPFLTNSLLPKNSVVDPFLWQKGYFHIYQSNAILDNLEKSYGLSSGVKNQLEGEAKFFRAFFHFYLTSMFGAIPIVTTADYRNNAQIARSDTVAVYRQIIEDLKEAKSLLLAKYPTAEKVRVNKWAATALLARVYLYLKDWKNAEAEASEVINSGDYQLAPVASAFLPNNSEAILQFLPASTQGFNTSEGFAFIPASASAVPVFTLTDTVINAFEAGDQRKTRWIGSNTVSGKTYYYPMKYRTRQGSAGAPKSEYNIVLRLAEQYLIRTEARAYQNNLVGALSDLNLIRKRAGVADATAADATAIVGLVYKERLCEYFAEWGHRWFDLKRTGAANPIVGKLKGGNWQATDVLYPIPQSEIDVNPSLTQNSGY